MESAEWSEPTRRMLAEIERRTDLRRTFTVEPQSKSALALAVYLSMCGDRIVDTAKAEPFALEQAKRLLEQFPTPEQCQLVIDLFPGSPIALRAKARQVPYAGDKAARRKMHECLGVRRFCATRQAERDGFPPNL